MKLNAYGVYDLFKFNKMYRRRQQLTPYGVIGIGVFYFNPKAKGSDGSQYSLRDFETEGKKIFIR